MSTVDGASATEFGAVSSGRLAGRVLIVAGGSGGIGRAVCHAATAEGATVAIVDCDRARMHQTVGDVIDCGGLGDVMGMVLDVAVESDMAEMAQAVLERFGHIDALIFCAGILRGRGCPPHPVTEVSLEEWNQVLDTNLKGVFLSNRAVLPSMIERRRGDIINISSTSGRRGRANDAAYCASKFGVIGLSEAIGEEVRPYGVRVQVLLPDAVDTPIWNQNGSIRPEQALDPARVADLIIYMVTLPEDTVMVGPVIAPFRTRRRVPRNAGRGVAASESARG